MARLPGRVVLALLVCLIAWPAWADEQFHLTVLHTNDNHGMMLPFSYQRDNSPYAQAPRELGGLARRAALVARLREESAHPVALVDAGDVFTRGPWHEAWFGVPEIEAMNLMGYDLLMVGNNEVKPRWGDPRSRQMMLSLMRRSRFPWLAANLTLGTTPLVGGDAPPQVERIHPFVVRAFGEVQVGFLAVTTAVGPDYGFLEGWSFGDPIAAARHWVPIAREECDVLLVVSHAGYDTDRRLAAEVPGIDAIIGGHSHTFLSEPERVISPTGQEVPIAQAGEHGVVWAA